MYFRPCSSNVKMTRVLLSRFLLSFQLLPNPHNGLTQPIRTPPLFRVQGPRVLLSQPDSIPPIRRWSLSQNLVTGGQKCLFEVGNLRELREVSLIYDVSYFRCPHSVVKVLYKSTQGFHFARFRGGHDFLRGIVVFECQSFLWERKWISLIS